MLTASPDIEVDANDIWVTIVTILFVLSLISERITNLIKLYIPSLVIEAKTDIEKNKRDRKIMLVALGSGMFVSVFSGAHLFTLIDTGQLSYLTSSKTQNDLSLFNTVLGLFLSGVFISMGSKFWHDVLDIVLEFSNLKKYRAKKEEQEVDNLEATNFRLIEIKLNEKISKILPRLRDMSGFIGCHVDTFNPSATKVVLQFEDHKPSQEDKNFLNNYFEGRTGYEYYNLNAFNHGDTPRE